MQQLYANELDNLAEMNKFLETHKLSKLIQQEIEHLHISKTSKETD